MCERFSTKLMICATDQEVAAFLDGALGPDAEDRFKLAYQHKPAHSWNKCAIEWLLEVFFLCRDDNWWKEDKLPEALTHEEVRKRLTKRFYVLKDHYLAQNRTPVEYEEYIQKKTKSRRKRRRDSVGNFL
jgi:hypothetical protein